MYNIIPPQGISKELGPAQFLSNFAFWTISDQYESWSVVNLCVAFASFERHSCVGEARDYSHYLWVLLWWYYARIWKRHERKASFEDSRLDIISPWGISALVSLVVALIFDAHKIPKPSTYSQMSMWSRGLRQENTYPCILPPKCRIFWT